MNEFSIFESVPTRVEGAQWQETVVSYQAIEMLTAGKCRLKQHPMGLDQYLEIQAGVDGASGWVTVPRGDWVLRNPNDTTDIWPIDSDRFIEKYRTVEEP